MRPNRVGVACQAAPTGRDLINCFDAGAFALPDQFTFGNASRNLLRGPKDMQTDLSLIKNVPIGGTARVQVRLEFFNIFNNVNYANPNGVFGSANFGRINALATGANMRQIQLGGKVIF